MDGCTAVWRDNKREEEMKTDRLAEQKSRRYDTEKETAVTRRTDEVLLREKSSQLVMVVKMSEWAKRQGEIRRHWTLHTGRPR